MSSTHCNREEARLKATLAAIENLSVATGREAEIDDLRKGINEKVTVATASVDLASAKVDALTAAKAECEAKLAMTDLPEDERKLTEEQIQGLPETLERLNNKARMASQVISELSAEDARLAAERESLHQPRLEEIGRLKAVVQLQEDAIARKKITAAQALRRHQAKFGKKK